MSSRARSSSNFGQTQASSPHYRKHSLARAPAHAGEIQHATARLDVDRVDAILAHQLLRLLDPRFAFFERDGNDVGRHGSQTSNRLWLRSLLRLVSFSVSVSERAAE